jgi:hypothetical protein
LVSIVEVLVYNKVKKPIMGKRLKEKVKCSRKKKHRKPK